MGGGTEAFPDLGAHCSHEYCKQLDFLPFQCDGCHKMFCLEHRTYKAHDCPRSEHKSRVVVVCELCAAATEKASPEEDEEAVLERHRKSGECDVTKKHKPRCPVRRCREILTFSNNTTCKVCHLKVCLKHRFPADHDCEGRAARWPAAVMRLPGRNGRECGDKKKVPSPTAIKAY